ncbi:hypothetical protein AYR66_26355 [Noviherbaspirillum denitrificans]|uniref:Response regulatory domain-containing protein n=2 Tax=Noviherbaspirillum denitrificans TaxID=1968433 RepID=A0A254TJW7_9BURK|nr:hypothetical protein AYR66_26355 [Noviherbaspirillum denitrificans]
MLRVVLVQDNLLYAKELAGYLQEIGHTVTVARAMPELWAAVMTESPDVILLDLNLPDASGLTSIPRLIEAYPATRILVLTGRTSADMGNEALRIGAHAHLVKPVKLLTLATHLQDLNEPELLEF